ncbi:glycosyl hydrolase [Viscerimonas tarda]
MNLKKYFICGLIIPACFNLSAKDIEVKTSLQNENRTLSQALDLHLTDANNPLANSTVNITSEEAWLFFDNMKPSKVLSNYKNSIKINGAAVVPFTNCRLVVYKQGAALIPHASTFQPLETFTGAGFGGSSQKYAIDQYYSNSPDANVPPERRAALTHDNSIRSMKLKRGYMATLANEPDGMGYSRCFIADREDLEINLPVELDGKVSFIRVFQWEWPSKKGWVGTYWGPGDDGKGGLNEGLRYADQQADLTNSTWYYTWGATVYGSANATATSLVNQEFVPEKWGKGGNVSAFYTNKRWLHLLGANEPDHEEQSNMTVEEAIAEWPALMKTGARLGAPATTDFTWLYNFMEQCRVRNYRVDYVAIHAYWGGKSASNWYKDLKNIHDRTGRPIWITEWNNGANWTTEGGWSGKDYNASNATKQFNDLKGILNVLDTASFVERHSLYNWVQDCRMIILGNDAGSYGQGSTLTKAGEYFAADSPGFAFNPDKEVIPAWVMQVPKLSYSYVEEAGKIRLAWMDANGELTDSYRIEQSQDGQNWETVDEISGNNTEYFTGLLSPDEITTGEVSFRMILKLCDGRESTSNIVKYNVLSNQENAAITLANLGIKDDWSMYLYANRMDNNAVVTLGTPTYRNRYPLVARTRNANDRSFEMELRTWTNYLTGNYPSAFTNPDTLAYLALPRGWSRFGNVSLWADKVQQVGKAWKTVVFETPFEVVPVIFATQLTANDETATAIRVRNITKTGFEVCRKYEQGKTNVYEDISYIAATPGSALYNGTHRIEVGITPNAAGVSYQNSAKIQFENTFDYPAFFGFMQTCNDETAATLRLKSKGSNSVEIFKEKEKTVNATLPAAEIIGYMVFGLNRTTGINTVVAGNNSRLLFDKDAGRIYLSDNALINKVDIYSVLGTKVLSASNTYDLSVENLPAGIYIAVVNGKANLKFIKQ